MHDNEQTTVSRYMTTLCDGCDRLLWCSYQLHNPCIEQTILHVYACSLRQVLQIPLFAADEAGFQQSEVEITLGVKGVEKRFTAPGRHVQELLDVYGLLQHLKLPGAIRCTSLKVSKFCVQ